MVDRIRQLIQERQLTSTQFADVIGVARPIVSHILSGRNKPSLEVVQKIIAAFPDISMPWLLTGQGLMTAESPANAAQPPSAASSSARVAAAPKRAPKSPTQPNSLEPPVKPSTVPEPAFEDPREPSLADAPERTAGPPIDTQRSKTDAAASSNKLNADDALVQAVAQSAATQPKTIRRVLIFYSDGTFTDYTPATEPL
ncbi:helix-turn-helix domain-containing protein [Solirubrum puertoriconensis]|uniref:helix-turn-helix domain-containing protein n=1 Tax=Solirubrum puertoriconensis TaxID=1751427 RepID=UPI00098EADA0